MYDHFIIGDKDRMKSKPAFKAFGKYCSPWNHERLSATIRMVGEEFPKEQLIRKRILKMSGIVQEFDGLEYEPRKP